MVNLRIWSLIIAVLLPFMTFAQKENSLLRSGNREYADGKFNQAEIDYRKALEKNPTSKNAIFNLGTSLYKQDNLQESAKLFAGLAQAQGLSNSERSEYMYNLGNSFLKEKKYKESIEYYKGALILNPKNDEARYNLAYARKFINENDEKNNNNQNQQDQNQQQDQQQQQQQQQNQDNKQDNKQNQNQQQQDQQQGQQQHPKELSRKDAARMLEALKNNEKQTREKMKLEEQETVRLKSTDKDW